MSTYCQNCGILRMSNVAYCHACVETELAGRDAEIERLRGQLLLEQDRVKLLKEDCDHLREVVRQLNDDRHLDAWEEK